MATEREELMARRMPDLTAEALLAGGALRFARQGCRLIEGVTIVVGDVALELRARGIIGTSDGIELDPFLGGGVWGVRK